jgi:hypothetical protein
MIFVREAIRAYLAASHFLLKLTTQVLTIFKKPNDF